MPFHPVMPRSFSVGGIRAYAPATPGVYGVSNAREWIFIGQTHNIQGKLLEHLGDMDGQLQQRRPTGFVFEACDPWVMSLRQDRLIREYNPVCNRKAAIEA